MDNKKQCSVMVADGTLYLCNSTTQVIHNEQVTVDLYKVSLDNPYSEFIDVPLPCASKNGITTKVGEAKGHFLEWPKDLAFILGEEEELFMGDAHQLDDIVLEVGKKATTSQKNESPKLGVGSTASQMKTFNPMREEKLGDECQNLASWISSPDKFVSEVIPIAPPLFYFTNIEYTVVSKEDIEEFLNMQEINVSILHVYQLFLMEEYAHFFGESQVSFLCPGKLDAKLATKHPTKYRSYLRDAFLAEKNKKDNQYKFLLAPYNERDHWMLFVIALQAGEVYVFNSIKNDNLRALKIYLAINLAFQIYKTEGGKTTKMSSKEMRFMPIECAQQNGKKECGYYIMMFMHEIVSNYSDSKNLKDAYIGSLSAYAPEEINVVREQWAKFFWTMYVSSKQ